MGLKKLTFNTGKKSLVNPYIWVKNKETGTESLIERFYESGDVIMVESACIVLEALYEHFTFLDDSPCGVLME